MKRIAIILLMVWPLMRIAFHLTKTTPSPDPEMEYAPDPNMFIYQMYFISNGAAMAGLFGLLNWLSVLVKRHVRFMIAISFSKYTLTLFIYSIWCFLVDVLMLFGVGNKDSIIYTGVSIILLFISILWSFVSKH